MISVRYYEDSSESRMILERKVGIFRCVLERIWDDFRLKSVRMNLSFWATYICICGFSVVNTTREDQTEGICGSKAAKVLRSGKKTHRSSFLLNTCLWSEAFAAKDRYRSEGNKGNAKVFSLGEDPWIFVHFSLTYATLLLKV